MLSRLKRLQPLTHFTKNKHFISGRFFQAPKPAVLNTMDSWDEISKETQFHINIIKNHYDERLAGIASDLLDIIKYISNKKITAGEMTSALEWDSLIRKKMNQCEGSYKWRMHILLHDDVNRGFNSLRARRKDVLQALGHIAQVYSELDKMIYPTLSSQEQRSFGL